MGYAGSSLLADITAEWKLPVECIQCRFLANMCIRLTFQIELASGLCSMYVIYINSQNTSMRANFNFQPSICYKTEHSTMPWHCMAYIHFQELLAYFIIILQESLNIIRQGLFVSNWEQPEVSIHAGTMRSHEHCHLFMLAQDGTMTTCK